MKQLFKTSENAIAEIFFQSHKYSFHSLDEVERLRIHLGVKRDEEMLAFTPMEHSVGLHVIEHNASWWRWPTLELAVAICIEIGLQTPVVESQALRVVEEQVRVVDSLGCFDQGS